MYSRRGPRYRGARGSRGGLGQARRFEREERGPANIAMLNFKPADDDEVISKYDQHDHRERSRSPVYRQKSRTTKFQAAEDDEDEDEEMGHDNRRGKHVGDLRNIIRRRDNSPRNGSKTSTKVLSLHERFTSYLPHGDRAVFNSPEVIMIGLERQIKGREPHVYRKSYRSEDVVIPKCNKTSKPICERKEFTQRNESRGRRVRVKVDRQGRRIQDLDDYRDRDTGKLSTFTVEWRNGRRSIKGCDSTGDRRVVRRDGPREEPRRSRNDRSREGRDDDKRSKVSVRDRLDLRDVDSRRLDGGRHRRDSDMLAKREAVLSAIVNKSIHERLGPKPVNNRDDLPDFTRRENRFENTEPLDPTVIPKGNRYYEHDNRDANFSRRGNRFDRSYNMNKSKDPSASMWKHDKFEMNDDGEGNKDVDME